MEESRKTTCMYCFADTGGATKCPNCGGDASAVVPQDHLIPGTVLNETWLIGRAVGQDASGIVYVAMDMNKRAKARIREYFPKDCAQRMPDGSIQIVPGEDERYNEGLMNLRANVQNAEDPEKRHPFFETNNTIYVVQMRKKKAAAAEAHEEEAEPSILKKQIIIFAAVIAVLVIGVLIAVGSIGRNAADRVNTDTLATVPPILHTLQPTDAPAEPTLAPSAQPTLDPFGNLPTSMPLDWQGVQGTGNNSSDDYYNAYDDITDRVTPTPVPTRTPDSSAVNPDSSTEKIQALQWRLIELGWLDATTASGQYDTDTRYAVAYFQKLIRDEYGADVKANGYADATTMRWLNDADAPVNPARTPAPTATPAPTETPAPTGTPAPVETIAPEGPITDESDPSRILGLQNRLVELGWLEAEYATGAYNTQTRYAVAYFQKELKAQGIDVAATGYADVLTQTWLNEAGAPRPTPVPTEAPVSYTYRIEQYYFTAVDGALNSSYDIKETNTFTTTETSLTIDAPASAHEGYVFAPDSEYNIMSNTFTDPAAEYRYRVIYVKDTVSPTPAPTETPVYSYRVDQYYFTAVDGVLNSNYDQKVEGEVLTTTENSLTVEAPASAYEGYVFDPENGYNRASMTFDDPNTGYVFQLVYVNNTVAPEPTEAPTPEPTVEAGPINESSSAERILALQNRLVELGWLEDTTDADGSYNIPTVNAVTAFQDKLTSLYGTQLFDGVEFVPGYADIVTQQYLAAEDAIRPDPVVEPTEAPTPVPTETPAPELTQYSYRVNQVYFTAMDGVMNSEYDDKIESDVLTTTESALTISVPESAHEGYTFDASSPYNVLSMEFTDPANVHTYQVIYIRQTASPTPAPTPAPVTEYSYRIDQYYFTAVDGVLNSDYDQKVEGEVLTTTETSLSVEAPASAYEGYVFDPENGYNRLSITFDDPNTGYIFQVIYVNNTVTPEPTPAPATEYSYRVNQYYLTAVDGVLNGSFDHVVEGDVMTTAETSMTVDAPASVLDGYVFASDSEYNVLSHSFSDATQTYEFRVIYVNYTTSPEPTPQPEPEPTPVPEPTQEPAPEAPVPEQVITDDQVNALPGIYTQFYPEQVDMTPEKTVLWIQTVLKLSDTTYGTTYFPVEYEPTGVYDADTMLAITALQQLDPAFTETLDPANLGLVTPETFQLIFDIYNQLKAG